MGVSRLTVRHLRARGRLRGYQRKAGIRNWWFFQRDEVEDLLADREYAKHRRAAQKGPATVRARQSESPPIIYSRYRDEE